MTQQTPSRTPTSRLPETQASNETATAAAAGAYDNKGYINNDLVCLNYNNISNI